MYTIDQLKDLPPMKRPVLIIKDGPACFAGYFSQAHDYPEDLALVSYGYGIELKFGPVPWEKICAAINTGQPLDLTKGA